MNHVWSIDDSSTLNLLEENMSREEIQNNIFLSETMNEAEAQIMQGHDRTGFVFNAYGVFEPMLHLMSVSTGQSAFDFIKSMDGKKLTGFLEQYKKSTGIEINQIKDYIKGMFDIKNKKSLRGIWKNALDMTSDFVGKIPNISETQLAERMARIEGVKREINNCRLVDRVCVNPEPWQDIEDNYSSKAIEPNINGKLKIRQLQLPIKSKSIFLDFIKPKEKTPMLDTRENNMRRMDAVRKNPLLEGLQSKVNGGYDIKSVEQAIERNKERSIVAEKELV